VADAVGAVGECVGDQLEVGRFAGVDRDVEVPLAGERERLGVQRRRPSRSRRRRGRTRPPCRRGAQAVDQSGDLERPSCSVRIAQQIALTVIRRPSAASGRLATAEPRRHRRDDVLERQPPLCAAPARIAPRRRRHRRRRGRRRPRAAIRSIVLGGLHHRDGVLERGEVLEDVAVSAPRVNHAWSSSGSVAAASSRWRRRARSRWWAAGRRRGGRAAAPSATAELVAGDRLMRGRARTACPLNHGMPSSAGGLRRCAPTDTATSVTTYGVTNTSWLLGSLGHEVGPEQAMPTRMRRCPCR
jgi:hypothetical protein